MFERPPSLPALDAALFDAPTAGRLAAATPSGHRPRFLMLYGSLRERSYSRLLSFEAARLLVYQAAAKLAAGEKCTKEASMAKSFASRIANKACYDAVQIHGGNGFVREFPVERYFRDVRVTEIYEGTTEVQSLIVAREVLG